MDGTLLIIIAIGALLAFFLYGRRASHPIAPNKASAPSPPTRPPPLTEEERIVQEAAEVRDRWKREREAVQLAHDDEMQPIHERIQKARQFVEVSGNAACDILRIMWHCPRGRRGIAGRCRLQLRDWMEAKLQRRTACAKALGSDEARMTSPTGWN